MAALQFGEVPTETAGTVDLVLLSRAASLAWKRIGRVGVGRPGLREAVPVIAAVEKAGFELVGSSGMNANPRDQPTEQESVWRLPLTFRKKD